MRKRQKKKNIKKDLEEYKYILCGIYRSTEQPTDFTPTKPLVPGKFYKLKGGDEGWKM